MLDKPTPVAAARVICEMRSPNDDLKRRGAGATARRGDRGRVTIAGWLTSPRIDDTHLGNRRIDIRIVRFWGST